MMEHLLKPLILWLHLHPNSAGFVTFLITFFESLAIIGIAIPGSVTLSAIGGLIGSGVIPAATIFVWAIVGAILGDGISFWIGYRYHNVIRNIWPFTRFPKLITKGEEFFAKHGGKSIFLGRFVGFVRPIMPLVAGMLRVKPSKFIMIDVLSGILWAPVYMIPGILVGAAAAHFAPHRALHYVFVLLIIIFVVWLSVWLSRLFLRLTFRTWQSLFDLIWQRLQRGNSILYRLIYEHEHPNRSRPLSVLILAMAFGLLFLLILISILLHWQPLHLLNLSISNFTQSVYNPRLENVAIIISTFFGEYSVICGAALLVGVYFVIRKDWHALWHLCAALGIAVLIISGFKWLIPSVRPQVVILPPNTCSLPSGHTFMSLIFFGYLAFLIGHNSKVWQKRLAYCCAAAIVLIVAMSRLYLNVHWLSDILASIFLGTSLLCFVVLFYRCSERRNEYQNSWLVIITTTGLLLLGGAYYHKHHQQMFDDMQLKNTSYQVNTTQWWTSQQSLLPIYRNDRFGKPAQVLNLQWRGDIEQIKTSLERAGWRTAQLLSVQGIKQQLFGKDVTLISPVPEMYENHLPALVMMKSLRKQPNAYLLLRLWDANYATPSAIIYLGNVSYHLPAKSWLWLHNKNQCSIHYLDAIHALDSRLPDWQINYLHYKPNDKMKRLPCIQDAETILKLRLQDVNNTSDK